MNALTADWEGTDIRLSQVNDALAKLRADSAAEGAPPNLRTSVMTHLAWIPEPWADQARAALAGMGERHPSRSILLFPQPHAGSNKIDARVAVECYAVPDVDRLVCSDVVELELLGTRAEAPASIVEPLLISDLPVFLRWRGEPAWGSQELDQLIDLADRLIVDSTEWDDVPNAYQRLAALFEQTAVSDIAWARTSRWRSLLATCWPEIAGVSTIQVTGTAAQGWLLCGWLRSRLGREIELDLVPAERLIGIELDGKPAPFPSGDPPLPSDVLSDELDRFTRDRIYEDAVRALL